MKSILIVFFIVCFIFMILLFPFKVKGMFHIDMISMKCFYSFKVWRVKILCGRAKMNETKEIVVENSDNLMSFSLDKGFALILFKEIIKKINIKKIELYFTGGFEEDSYSSALVCGTMLALTKTIYSILSLIYEDIKMYEDISSTFNETNFDLSMNVCVMVSLMDIMISLIKSDRIKTKKLKMEVKSENR